MFGLRVSCQRQAIRRMRRRLPWSRRIREQILFRKTSRRQNGFCVASTEAVHEDPAVIPKRDMQCRILVRMRRAKALPVRWAILLDTVKM